MGINLLQRRHALLASNGDFIYWNQLLPNFSPDYYSAVTTGSAGAIYPSITYNNNIATMTYNSYSEVLPKGYKLSNSITLLANNKYYASLQIFNHFDSSTNFRIFNSTNQSVDYGSWSNFTTIYSTSSTNSISVIASPLGSPSSGNYYQVKIPILINLTLMFGTGNQPDLATFENICANNDINLSVYQPQIAKKAVVWKI